jgi:hypothetical protein
LGPGGFRPFSPSDWIVGTSLRSSLARFDSWRRGRRDGATVARRAHTPMPFGRVGSTPTPATAARLGDGRASYARARGFDSLRSDPCQHPFTVGWSEIFSECSPVEGRLSRVQEAGGSIPLTPTTCRTSKLVNAPVLQTAVAGFDPLVLHHVVCFLGCRVVVTARVSKTRREGSNPSHPAIQRLPDRIPADLPRTHGAIPKSALFAARAF